jgi:hypothetical protein
VVVLFIECGKRTAEVRRYEFRRVALEHPEAQFYEVDLVENPSLAERYAIPSAPVTLVFVHGIEVARHVGGPLEATVGRALDPGSGDPI